MEPWIGVVLGGVVMIVPVIAMWVRVCKEQASTAWAWKVADERLEDYTVARSEVLDLTNKLLDAKASNAALRGVITKMRKAAKEKAE